MNENKFRENPPSPEPLPKKASDLELAAFLIKHIDDPCEVQIGPGETANIRQFYIEEAKRHLPTFTNTMAREALEGKIKEYEQ